jgi:hypothetical protein
MPIDFPTPGSECNTYGYTYDSNCTGSDGVTLDYDQTWHAVVLNGVTAWVPLSGESSTGVDGSDGAQGRQGPVGASGTQGFQGVTGPAGNPGNPGNEGTPGDDGPRGNTGADAVAPGLAFSDINILETMFIRTIGPESNEFSVSSTDAFTYDPANCGAMRINRIRENVTTISPDGSGVLELKGVCGPAFYVNTSSDGVPDTKVTNIRLNFADVSNGAGLKNWMVGDFCTLLVRQSNPDSFFSGSNQFGHDNGPNQLTKNSSGDLFDANEIKYGNGRTGCMEFGGSVNDIDVLYINCINDPGGTIKPYFLVNHLQYHDGLPEFS